MIHLLFMITLVIAGAVDAATNKIHNLFPLLIAALAIARLVCDPSALPSRVIGCFLLSVPMLLLALGKGGLGGGDIKLTAACGLFLGADALLRGALIAGLLALIVHLFLQHTKKAGSQDVFAFGPYLAIGFIFSSLL